MGLLVVGVPARSSDERQGRELTRTLIKKKYVLLAAGCIILLGGYFTYAKAKAGSSGPQYITQPVARGMIASTVSASGNMGIGDSASITPAVSGTVTNVQVKLGDTVKKGQVLFTVSNDQLDINVSKSYASLLQAQQGVDSANANAAQAQADLDNGYGQAGTPASDNIAALNAKLSAAQTALNLDQQSLNSAQTTWENTPQSSSNYNSVLNSYIQAQQKVANDNASVAQAQSDLAKAQQQNQATNESNQALGMKLDAASAGVSAAQQSLTAAQQDYQNQQNLAAQRTVTAPLDGVITTLNVKEGDTINSNGTVSSSTSSSAATVSSSSGSGSGGSSPSGAGSSGSGSSGSPGAGSSGAGASGGSGSAGGSGGSNAGGAGGSGSSSGAGSSGGNGGSSGSSGSSGSASSSSGSSGSGSSGSSSPALIVQDLSSLTANVQVTEVDVAKLQLSQKVMLTFDAIDGLTLTGKVNKLDVSGTVNQGVVTYNVGIALDTSDPRVKPGMSVTADITTDTKQDVLTVPNSAIKTQGSNSYVQILDPSSNAPRQQPVSTGMANDTLTEITNGLNEGDQVVVQTINPNASSGQSGSSGGGLGGGGLGGLGGAGGAMRGGGGGGQFMGRGGGGG